jgi:tRNA pseudouridine38-40 synthase
MGVLIQLGKGELNLDFIKKSLSKDNDRKPTTYIAPSSGLQLYKVEFIK